MVAQSCGLPLAPMVFICRHCRCIFKSLFDRRMVRPWHALLGLCSEHIRIGGSALVIGDVASWRARSVSCRRDIWSFILPIAGSFH